MNCTTAHEMLLEAELAELQGTAETALAGHLRGCPSCRAKADAIVAGYAALDASFSTGHPSRRVPRVLRWLEIALPLAAAAVLVLVLTQPGHHASLPSAPATSPAAPAAAPLVSAPAAHDVTIMHTDDPNIVVVWLN